LNCAGNRKFGMNLFRHKGKNIVTTQSKIQR